MKNKQDAFAEIEKQEYTYDLNGNIIFVKKPKTTGGAQTVVLDYELNPAAREEERKRQEARNNKGKRLLSAKPTQAKELKVIKETKKEDEVLEEVSFIICTKTFIESLKGIPGELLEDDVILRRDS